MAMSLRLSAISCRTMTRSFAGRSKRTTFRRLLSACSARAETSLLASASDGRLRKGFTTFAGNCFSICAAIWLAGSERYVANNTKLGFHAAYRREGQGKKATAVVSSGGNAIVGAYYGQLGLSDNAIYWLTSAPPQGGLWMNAKVARELGITFINLDDPVKKTEAQPCIEATPAYQAWAKQNNKMENFCQ